MGAVFGHLGRSGPADRAGLRRMATAAPHRGHEVSVVELGHSVLGVSSGDGVGVSDVATTDRLAIAFSGRLDNVEELAAETEHRRTDAAVARSPAAVVGAAFEAFGTEAPVRMRGPFAVVVTDGERLWAFRDHVGFRSLFHREEPDGVYVASEAKQVAAGADIPYGPDSEAVRLIFYGRLDGKEERCAVDGVRRLPPGSLLVADAERVQASRFWHPERLLETTNPEPEDLRDRFDELMRSAVGRCLTGDDVISLSGGVDSPAVAAYAAPVYRERTGEPLPALTSVFPDFPSVDESRYVEQIAEELGLRLHTLVPKSRPTDDLDRWVRLFDGPVPVVSLAEAAEYLEHARSLGFRNVLQGDLAEYVFDFGRYTLPHLVAHGRLGAAASYARERWRRGVGLGALAEDVAKALVPPRLRAYVRALRGDALGVEVPAWLDPREIVPFSPRSGRELWREDQLTPFRGPGLSFEADDGIQSVTGVSIRRPFADVDLWEFFLSLPAEVKFPRPGRKPLVRSLLRGKVPDIVLDRRDKTVFDEFIHARVDYGALRRWILETENGFRMPGVDYDRLADRLQAESLELREFMWAKDLAAAHAFMARW